METEISIRKMTIADYPVVYELWKRDPGIGMRSIDDSEAGIKQFLDRNPNTCFVACLANDSGAELAGVLLAGHDGRRGYIYHAMVKERLRGKGIGAALTLAVERALKNEGITKIALVAFRRNERGNCFWEKHGYTERQDLVYRNKSINDLNE